MFFSCSFTALDAFCVDVENDLSSLRALFRALKTKQPTPKYGIIYHATLVGQAPPKFKGKIARVLAAKSALSIQSDALGEYPEPIVGIEGWAKVSMLGELIFKLFDRQFTFCVLHARWCHCKQVEARLQQLEGRELGKSSGAAHGKANIESYDKDRKKENPGVLSAAKVKQDIDIVPLIQLPNNKAS